MCTIGYPNHQIVCFCLQEIAAKQQEEQETKSKLLEEQQVVLSLRSSARQLGALIPRIAMLFEFGVMGASGLCRVAELPCCADLQALKSGLSLAEIEAQLAALQPQACPLLRLPAASGKAASAQIGRQRRLCRASPH